MHAYDDTAFPAETKKFFGATGRYYGNKKVLLQYSRGALKNDP